MILLHLKWSSGVDARRLMPYQDGGGGWWGDDGYGKAVVAASHSHFLCVVV